MSSLSNVINLIKNDLYKEKKDSVYIDFFYSSILHYAISLEIASATKPLTFETLCKVIPKKIGGRSSIKTVLDNAVRDNFFIKEKNLKDKRQKNYKFSEDYSLMITDWYLGRKERYVG